VGSAVSIDQSRKVVVMKQVRSKSLETQRKQIELSLNRTAKSNREFTELTYRNWTGGEMPLVAPTKEIQRSLAEAEDALRNAERQTKVLRDMARQRGK
jgi:hypothetical protein